LLSESGAGLGRFTGGFFFGVAEGAGASTIGAVEGCGAGTVWAAAIAVIKRPAIAALSDVASNDLGLTFCSSRLVGYIIIKSKDWLWRFRDLSANLIHALGPSR
jgi:hypothetical protein